LANFIDPSKIEALLLKAKSTPPQQITELINKAKKLKGLSPEETAVLLECQDQALIEQIYTAAREIKEAIYGKRLVIFAPLYISNYCANDCHYCGFRTSNKALNRKRLSIDEIIGEVEAMEEEGHKRILLLAGEDAVGGSIENLEKVIPAIYATKKGHGEIRRLNVNVAPMSVEDFKRLKKTGIGTYQLFQETYHPDTFRAMHPSGPKADYLNHLTAMHRAMEAGINDVGIGVLFGLHDFKFEVLALLFHALELERQFGVGPHTISIPRIEPAFNTPLADNPPAKVSDEDFKKLVAILRLAVPYTGIILSTRESAQMRNQLFGLGVSQISAGSRTNPGGYQAAKQGNTDAAQFSLNDDRTLLEVIKDIAKMGYSPSFCTACYRLGRTGKDFMDLAKPGLIQEYCLPNSLFTFKEYLLDYADDETRKLGEQVIIQQLANIKNKTRQIKAKEILQSIETGRRDLCL